MRGLLNSLADFPEFIDATSENNLSRSHNLVTPPPSFPFLIAQIAQSRPVLVISGSSRGAEDIASELRDLHDRVLEFPAWETLPHERLSPRSDTVARRIQTLNELAHSGSAHNPIVITPVRGVIHRIIADLAKKPLRFIEQGQEISLSELIKHLTDLAYVRTDLVEKRGEFAVRGGIIDLFLPLTKHPVRIDFFGDEIEELNYFEVSGQRTSEPVIGKLEIFPCRELLLTPEIQVKANDLISKFPAAAEMLDRMAAGIATEGMESLIPLLIEDQETLLDRMPANTEIIFLDEERIRSRAADLLSTNDEFLAASWSNAAVGAIAPVHTGVSTYLAWDELAEKIISLGLNRRSLNSFGSDLSENTDFMAISAIDPLRGDMDQLLAVLGEAVLNNFKVIFTANGHGMVERYAGIFRGADLPVYVVEQLQAKPTAGLIHITTTPITYGFSYPSAQILFITEHDLTGSKSRVKDSDRLPSKRKQSVDPLELKAGDFVVHEQHGIGRYVEMIQRETAGVVREYLIIEYASAKRGQPGDRIFVPTDSLEQVSKYIGGESPTVHRIGSGEWQKAKGRARKAVRQIAG
jgi:transcription-repair coupling factor (superfamily II helicase)